MSTRITQINSLEDPYRRGARGDNSSGRSYKSIKSGKAWHWKGATALAALHWAEADHDVVSYEFRPHTLAVDGQRGERTSLWTPDLLIDGAGGPVIVKLGTPDLLTMFGLDMVQLQAFYGSRGQQFSLHPPGESTEWHREVQAYRCVLVTESDRVAVGGLDGDDAVRALNSRYRNEVVTMAKAAAMHVRRIIRLNQKTRLLQQVREIVGGTR